MKRVGFFLENASIASVDCSRSLESNPGIGGTEWLIIVVSTLLSRRNNNLSITLYTEVDGIFPVGINIKSVGSIEKCISAGVNDGLDYLVIKHNVQHIYGKALDADMPIKLICWCHVFVCSWELDYYADNQNVDKLVFVSREMYDMYIDHRGANKFTYIYNCVNTERAKELYALSQNNKDRHNVVTYIGSLVPFKGFHLLAKAWPKIIDAVPDAELNVIGSGRLYNNNQSLGEWGIAESSYEAEFMPYLTKEGVLLPNVKFWGVLGEEKDSIVLSTKVGVPNPSGISETFCLSAVEMQMLGAKVTSIAYPGLVDTIHYGQIYNNVDQLADNVIELLRTDECDYSQAMGFFEENFSYASVVSKWEELLSAGRLVLNSSLVHPFYRFKWLKYCLNKIKSAIPLFRGLPMMERILVFVERLFWGRVTYIDT